MKKAAFNKTNTCFIGSLMILIILTISQNVLRPQVTEYDCQKTNDLKAVEQAIHNVFG